MVFYLSMPGTLIIESGSGAHKFTVGLWSLNLEGVEQNLLANYFVCLF